MKKSTARPTVAQIQKNQAQADRKAAALARRSEKAQGFATELDDRTNLYRNTEAATKMTTPIQSSISRRLGGRITNLTNLGLGHNEAHFFILQALSAHLTDTQLKAKGIGQNSIIQGLENKVMAEFDLDWTHIDGLQDDPTNPTQQNTWGAIYLTDDQTPIVKAFINNLVTA